MGVFGKPGIIDAPNAVGGWSNATSTKAPLDSDADGMPDDWEIKHHLNPNNPTDRNLSDKKGYTNLEIYLNEKAIIK
jgi:pectate lyase